jgi:transcription initiation protein SPT3
MKDEAAIGEPSPVKETEESSAEAPHKEPVEGSEELLGLDELDDSLGLLPSVRGSSLQSKYNLLRLQQADELTQKMTREQYVRFSTAREASFTYKKIKKFRDWLRLDALGIRTSDEIVEILGYLAWEMVGLIAQTAVTVKSRIEFANSETDEQQTSASASASSSSDSSSASRRRRTATGYLECSNFTSPLLPVHIFEAMRELKPLDHSIVGFTGLQRRR